MLTLGDTKMKSMSSVSIHSQQVCGGVANIVASIYRKPGASINPEEFRSELQSRAGNKMFALAGSFTILDDGPQRVIVRGHMVPAHEVLPFQADMQGFKSLSRNVYQDEDENMWSLKDTGNGQFLIRANVIDDPSEIQQLMQSCSSAVPVGTDRLYHSCVAQAQANVDSVVANDAVLYAQAGELRFGIVLATASSDEGDNDTLIVLNPAHDTVDVVGRTQVAAAAAVGTVVDQETLVIPENLQQPQINMEAAASEQSDTVNKLVDYWKKVWGYGPDYFAAFERAIRGHTFA